jgi:hypothetical protein
MYKPVNNPQNAAVDNVLNYGIQFITSTNRHQTFFNMLEEQVAADNRVRAAGCFFGRPRSQKISGVCRALYDRLMGKKNSAKNWPLLLYAINS